MGILSIFANKKIVMNSDSLKLKYEGQEHQIDANTLINTLTHYNALVSQVNSLFGCETRDISLKINAPERGSFILNIDIVESVKDLFSSEGVDYLNNLTNAIVGLVTVFKIMRGKPIKEDEANKIVNNYNNCKIDNRTFVNIYNDQVVRSSISKSIETAIDDPAIDGVELSNNHGGMVSIDKEEFPDLIYDDFDKEEGAEEHGIIHEVIPNAILSIMVVSFEKKTKWKFMYNGIKLPSMDMKDAGLQKDIDEGKSFAKGDAIEVDLEVTKEFNPSYNAYENKKYRILRVIKHIPRPIQSKFID